MMPFIDRIMTMTDMQDKLFGSRGALEALSRIDTDIKSTLLKYGETRFTCGSIKYMGKDGKGWYDKLFRNL
jgi:hypothetical protein